ncbi:MAG: hypothetical protein ACI9C3_002716, partial [Yoonia sp.]
QLPYNRLYNCVDVVPFAAPFTDWGKVPQCPVTGTKFIPTSDNTKDTNWRYFILLQLRYAAASVVYYCSALCNVTDTSLTVPRFKETY